ARGEKSIYQTDLISGQITGPYFFQDDEKGKRNSIKTDLSYTIEDAWGQHSIKSGIEFQDEKFEDQPINNPVLVDITKPFNSNVTSGSSGSSAADQIQGFQILQTSEPLITPQRAASFNSGAYILDAWKPRPNLTLNIGVRIDREDIDSSGFTFF